MKQKRPWITAILLSGALGAVACYPLTIEDGAEADVVITRKSSQYDYSQNRTYALPDKVTDLCEIENIPVGEGGAGGEGAVDVADLIDCEEVTHVYDEQILEGIRRNLDALGYQEIANDSVDPPDVMVLVGTIASNNWVAYTSYPWWGYYPYYDYYWWSYYYGWYLYYPYYPTTTVVNYPTGAVMMQLVSLKNADIVNQRIPAVWTGVVRGLTDYSDENPVTRINGLIDQAFTQSQYLKVGSP